MTKEKLKSIFQKYYSDLTFNYQNEHPRQLRNGETQVCSSGLYPDARISHLMFMCQEAQKFVDEGRVEKAMRWLGFLQGVMWKDDWYSLNDLKNHSRPDEDPK
jgi:hypothetical protein